MVNRYFNLGYHHAYLGLLPQLDMNNDAYRTGYEVGKEDKAEDEEAIETGEWEPMSDSEREFIYGIEGDGI